MNNREDLALEPGILPGLRKAAILILALGEQAGAEIFKLLEEPEIEALGREIARLPAVPVEQAESVLEEFHRMVEGGMVGGVEYAGRVLRDAFGPETARKLADRLEKPLPPEWAELDARAKTDPHQVAGVIRNEHPQTMALVLSYLSPGSAACVLEALPPETQTEVSLRMAALEQISPEVASRIATLVNQELKDLSGWGRESCGGLGALAEALNRVERRTSREILEQIAARDPELAENIRSRMLTFEDLLEMGSSAMREILSRIDKKTLAAALKDAGERVRNHFMANLSERGAEVLREDMEAIGDISADEVKAAQQSILAVVYGLETEGISLRGPTGEQHAD